MKHRLSATLLISLALASSIHAQTYTAAANRAEITETYRADMSTGQLTIIWGKETTVFANIVGYSGQSSMN